MSGVVLAGLAMWMVGLSPRARQGQLALAAVVLVLEPGLGLLGLGLAGAVWVLRFRTRLARERRSKRAAEADVVSLGRLVGMGLSAGLNFQTGLEVALPELHPRLAREVSGVLRRSRQDGIASALAGASGLAEPLYGLAGRAIATGAPLGDAVEALVAEATHAERNRLLAEARRLPVKLLVPLALLILPGFVVLTVGPALVSAVERLRFPGP